MKVKELIQKLQSFDKNLEVIFEDDYSTGFSIYNKSVESFAVGNLEIVEGPLGNYIVLAKTNKGRYLSLGLTESDYYKPEDFKK